MPLPVRTSAEIRAQNEYCDTARYLPAGWQGTALDLLRSTQYPAAARLETVLYKGWMSDRTLLSFAAWAARQALALIPDPDPRSLAACAAVEGYAQGMATRADLNAATRAANEAYRDAVSTSCDISLEDAAYTAYMAVGNASNPVYAAFAASAIPDGAEAADATCESECAKQVEHLITLLELEEQT